MVEGEGDRDVRHAVVRDDHGALGAFGIGRAVVLSPGDEIALSVSADSAALLQIDGTPGGLLADEETVTVTLLADAARVMLLYSRAHAQRSRIELSLLDLPLRPIQLLELVPAHLRSELRLNPPSA